MKKVYALVLIYFLIFFLKHTNWTLNIFAPEKFISPDHPEYLEAGMVWVTSNIGSGSGFIVSDGYVVTNAHVVDQPEISVDVYVQNKYLPTREAKVIAMLHEENYVTYDRRDLALLRFDPPKSAKLPILSFNFDLKTEDNVKAWGYPREVIQKWLAESPLGRLRTPPVVSADGTISYIQQGKLGSFFISHSALTIKGYSGGPVMNDKDEVVGIATWGKSENESHGGYMQAAIDVAFFLVDNGVTPKLAPGQQMPIQVYHNVTEMIEAATVWIVVRNGSNINSGAGFIAGNGYIVTYANIVNRFMGNSVIYVLNKHISAQKAEIVKTQLKDEGYDNVDLALLRFEPPEHVRLPILFFNFEVSTNDRVRALGHTRTDENRILQDWYTGKLSSLEAPPIIYSEGKTQYFIKDTYIIHLDQPKKEDFFLKNCIGGPLVNDKGDVIGMNTGNISNNPPGFYTQHAKEGRGIAFFLIDNGITPRLAPYQRLPTRPE
jgi:S1-C subfamily serine protease